VTLPVTYTQEWSVSPTKSALHLADSAPEGYAVISIDRKMEKAVVTYSKIGEKPLPKKERKPLS
jgi:hypothetical protein